MSQPVAQLQSVGKDYAGRPVLRSVTLSVERGDIVGVGGDSGAGKSTLLRLVGGIERPDRGQVLWAGRQLWRGQGHSAPRPGYVMPVFQDAVSSLDPRWPIWRTVSEPRCIAERVGGAAARTVAAAELERVGLADLDPDARPHELSEGQCQRVVIARALAAKPDLIVADEPTSALDVLAARAVRELLRAVAADGTALVVASHDPAILGELAMRAFRIVDSSLEHLC